LPKPRMCQPSFVEHPSQRSWSFTPIAKKRRPGTGSIKRPNSGKPSWVRFHPELRLRRRSMMLLWGSNPMRPGH